jgi:poly(A) polymerase
MRLLGLPPGPQVGAALKHLLALRMEHGPLPRERAVDELAAWAAERGLALQPGSGDADPAPED